MGNAPERLWMDPSGIDEQDIVCGTINPPKRRGYLNCDVEYIRSDIHEAAHARMAELEAALRDYVEAFDDLNDPKNEIGANEYYGMLLKAHSQARRALEAKP